MSYTVTKMEAVGLSEVNQFDPCFVCKKYTPRESGPLLRFALWIESPRGAQTVGARMFVHESCLNHINLRRDR